MVPQVWGGREVLVTTEERRRGRRRREEVYILGVTGRKTWIYKIKESERYYVENEMLGIRWFAALEIHLTCRRYRTFLHS